MSMLLGIAPIGALDEFGKVLTFLVMISVLVVLHELGHFIVARRNGVHVNEFSVGMGPKVAGWRSPRSGTQYSLRALPIGGYCAMYGEDAKTGEAEQQREFRAEHAQYPQPGDETNFQAKSAWQRLRIILAGPIANFILAYLILLFGALAFGVQSMNAQPVIGEVTPHSPAAAHGLETGDRIVAVDGTPVRNGDALVTRINDSLGRQLTLAYERNGVQYQLNVTPVRCGSLDMQIVPEERNKGCIGFAPVPAYARAPIGQDIIASADEYGDVASEVFDSLSLLLTHFAHYAPQLTGVVGIGQVATTVQDFGWGPYLRLAAEISFALGVMNLLPIPALDGGRAAFVVAEIVRRRPVDPEREGLVHLAGFAVILMLMLVIAFHDISRIVSGQGVL